MAWFTGQLLLLLVAAFLLGLLLGYLVWIWGWRKRVEDDVEVSTSTREVAGGETARRTAELDARLAEQDTALAEREEALGLRDDRIAELEDEVRRLRTRADATDAASRGAADTPAEDAGGVATSPDTARPTSPSPTPAGAAVGATAGAATRRAEPRRDTLTIEDDAIDDLRIVHLLDKVEEERAEEDVADADRTDEIARVPAAASSDAVAATSTADDAASVAAEGPTDADEPEQTTVPDDLTRVEGIGPKMQAALGDAGVLTFGQLARTSEHEIRAAIVAAGMRFAPSVPTWATQAQLLADGDEDEFAAYQERLAAGREESRR